MKLSPAHPRKHARIEIIPLIDIMFFLLASFMMVSLSMDRTQNISVDLPPSAQASREFKPDMLNIAVDAGGAVWYQKNRLSIPELRLVVSNRFRGDTNVPVFISGDRQALHGAMTDVYEAVRAAGVQKVSFAVGGPEAPSAP